jgi:hypothetical protein
MRKNTRKLQLSRETLHQLALERVTGQNPSILPPCTAAVPCSLTCIGAKCTGAVCD